MPLNNPKVTEKDKFTIGDQELLSTSKDRPRGLQSIVQWQGGGGGRYGGRTYATRINDDSSVYSNLLPGLALSDCPSVNGIITTPYGSLSIGTVIAGTILQIEYEE